MTYGETAYKAYRVQRQGLTHDGRPMPSWEELGPAIQAGWQDAAKAVILHREGESNG